jgi:hypothetical protein
MPTPEIQERDSLAARRNPPYPFPARHHDIMWLGVSKQNPNQTRAIFLNRYLTTTQCI